MPDVSGNPTALDYIRDAAGHELLGDTSLIAATATGGTTTTLIDTSNLLTQSGDQQLQHRWVYFWSGSNAGSDRFVSSVAGLTGTLTWLSALGNAVAAGDEYLLFRDWRWRDWVAMANATMKQLYYPLELYLAGITDLQRYTVPTPISNPTWIMEVRRGNTPFRFTSPIDRHIRWHRMEPRFLNVQQQIYLALETSLTAAEQLLFECKVPYAHPHMSTFTMTRSVVTPFGETVVLNPPQDLVVMGIVWRALVRKSRTPTGSAQVLWDKNRKEAARRYAELCAANGVTKIGVELQYASPW